MQIAAQHNDFILYLCGLNSWRKGGDFLYCWLNLNFMELISIITIVLGIILLIAFFRMASDVSAMKDMLKAKTTAHYKTAYYVHLSNKNNPQATEALLSLIFSDIIEGNY